MAMGAEKVNKSTQAARKTQNVSMQHALPRLCRSHFSLVSFRSPQLRDRPFQAGSISCVCPRTGTRVVLHVLLSRVLCLYSFLLSCLLSCCTALLRFSYWCFESGWCRVCVCECVAACPLHPPHFPRRQSSLEKQGREAPTALATYMGRWCNHAPATLPPKVKR